MMALAGIEDIYAQPKRKIGQDILGLEHPKFNKKIIVKHFKKGVSIGYLDHTFSSRTAHLNYILRRVSPYYLRVHILNTVCVRNKNCGTYERLHRFTISSLDKAVYRKDKKVLDTFRERILFYKKLQTSFPKTFFLISPALEHNLSKKSWRVLADVAKEAWPDIQLVNNPLYGNPDTYLGAWKEKHGNLPDSGVHISSLDGVSPYKIDVKKWLHHTRKEVITFMHSSEYNCRYGDVFVDPRKRTKCVSEKELLKILKLTK